MRAAASRHWPVGTTFVVNRGNREGVPPLVFTIMKRTALRIYFRARDFDPPDHRNRKMSLRKFYRCRARREIVRVPA